MASGLLLRPFSRDAPSGNKADALRDLHRLEELGEDDQPLVREAEVVVIDAEPPTAIDLAQRVHAADPAVQTVVVIGAEQRAHFERLLLFAPGLGEVWSRPPEQLGEDLLEEARQVTRQRRRYESTRSRLDLRQLLPRHGTRVLISDAYLAALLQVLPDPVVSIDAAGRILSWNPAAERLLGYGAREAVGEPIAERLAAEPSTVLDALLSRGTHELTRGEVRLRTRSGESRILELTVLPVEAGGERVRSLVLHDVTETRMTQLELERQATELEFQAAQLQEQAAELEQLNEDLQSALTTRDRFYAAMSHELRTPINAVLGYNELLLEEIYGPLAPAQVEGLQKAQRAARHLLELVADVLHLAKIEAGRIEVEPARTIVPQLLQELVDTVAPVASESGVEIRIAGPSEPHSIVTDPRRVRQILLNLLSNAIKFGESRPVHVRWTPRAGGGVRVEVADRGRGIAAEDLERIFDEFTQVTGSSSAHAQGTGLGLPISLRLTRLLQGDLRVTSEVGRGSTFSLDLPAELHPAS